MSHHITIGSRGSDLALWQAHYTQDRLEEVGYSTTIRIIKTQGDRIQHLSFDKMEGKGFFTKELEEELLAGTIDLAVHSYKDLPSVQPPGLAIAGISERAHPADVLLVREEVADKMQSFHLPQDAVVGTSSARRKAQLLLFRPDVQLKDIRGNVPTRIQKLRDGNFDAILMAKAGLDRIAVDLTGLYIHVFDPTQFVPAPAQGVLAFQVREDDEKTAIAIAGISAAASAAVNYIERESLRILEGGCQIPLGIFAQYQNGIYHTWCSYSDSWQGVPHRLHLTAKEPELLPPKLLANIRKTSTKRIFISREQTEQSLFRRLMEQRGCEVIAQSLIDIRPVQVARCPTATVYCFSSRNAVRELAAQHPTVPAEEYWALGEGTAAAMRSVGWEPTYVGTGDALQVAAHLQARQPDHVVFPCAQHSRASIQDALGHAVSWQNLVVYSNRPKEQVDIPPVDIAVLTSPMNADAFVRQYPHKFPIHWVAIGEPTQTHLLQLIEQPIAIAYAPAEWSLADEVSTFL